MRPRRAGSLGRRLARWLALLTLVGLALTCLGIYTVTALSFKERQMDTLRQQQTQVNHLIAEAAELDSGTLAHKLDDGMVGRQDMKLILKTKLDVCLEEQSHIHIHVIPKTCY